MLSCDVDSFCGQAVAVSSGRVAFACPGHFATSSTGSRINSAGIIYVYSVSSSNIATFEARLSHSNAVSGDQLQITLSLFGTTLVAGMPYYELDQRLISQGGAAVFEYANGSWAEQIMITLPLNDAKSDDQLGWDVVAADGVIAVSSIYYDPIINGSIQANAGTVWIYTRSASGDWKLLQQLNSYPSQLNENFGLTMDMTSDGTQLIVSGQGNDATVVNAGRLYFFTRTSGTGLFEMKRSVVNWDGKYDASIGQLPTNGFTLLCCV
jgi:hypothetical protein